MNKKFKRLILGNLLFTAAVLSVIPWDSASTTNLMGYRSISSWAPVSTLFCLALAIAQLIKIHGRG